MSMLKMYFFLFSLF